MSHEASSLKGNTDHDHDGELGNWDKEELFEEKKLKKYIDEERRWDSETLFRKISELVGGLFSNSTTSFMTSALGIYACYFIYGILQESLFRDKSQDPPLKVEFTLMLVGFQSLVAFFIASGYNKYIRGVEGSIIPENLRAKLGTCHSMTMICSNAALIYVNYPTQALAKSCKILPVLLIGLLYQKYYPAQRYVVGVLITIGILVFNSSKLSKDTDEENSFLGLFLLFSSLFFDGLNATVQETLRRDHKPHAYDLMASANKYAAIASGVLYCVIGFMVMFFNADFTYIYFPSGSEITPLIIISFCGAFGQCFIFFMVERFGPLVLTIITTTRKFFTVLLSIFIYNHEMSNNQVWAMLFVFGAIIYDIYVSHQNKKNAANSSSSNTKGKEMNLPENGYQNVNTNEKHGV